MVGDFIIPMGKKERTEAFNQDNKMRLEAKKAERNETIANATKHREPLSHDQLVSDQINQIVDADDDLSDTLAAKVAKKRSQRPANWIDIVKEANKHTILFVVEFKRNTT